jgi:uracil-DNA glycosylase
MALSDIRIESGWKDKLSKEFEMPYMGQIKQILINEKAAGKEIYPPGPKIFNAFNSTPFEKVKVVILGQDPYHQPGQAMGLCFSVPEGVKVPASLVNIYKELKRDLGIEPPKHGDLSPWCEEGVFLLNAILTVEKNQAGSHAKIGWSRFTDAAIKALSDYKENLVFLLWGNYAKSKKTLIDIHKHHILESVHPSPLAGGKFIGCGHFSQTNRILDANKIQPVKWQLHE